MQSHHTFGPWIVVETEAKRFCIASAAASDSQAGHLAVTYGQPTQEADACLMAAAPEMFSLLLNRVALSELILEQSRQLGNKAEPGAWLLSARSVLEKIIGAA